MNEDRQEQSNKVFLGIVMLCVGIVVSIFVAGSVKKRVETLSLENEKKQDLELTLRTLNEREAALTKQIDELNEKYNNLLLSVPTENEEYHVLTKKLLAQNEKYSIYSGMTDVSGMGLRITLEDGDSIGEVLTEERIVHDSTLLRVVEGLRESGAQAISINEERVTATTAFTCVGTSIKVGGRKLYAPYVIKAIGGEAFCESFKETSVYELLTTAPIKFEMQENINVSINGG